MLPELQDLTVAVLGYLDADLGVGESARRWLRVIECVTPNVVPVAVPLTPPRASPFRRPLAALEVRDVDVRLLCFTADETRLMLHHPLVRAVEAKRSIGLWHWETEVFPWWLRGAFQPLDEVWAGSTFAQQAISRHTRKTVRAMPLPVALDEQAPTERSARAALGLPDRYLFLFEFDYRSVFERKNPVGAITAFQSAFAPGEGPVLLVKGTNGEQFPQREALLRATANGREDIILWNERLSAADNSSLMSACDVYVSLHRSEGFGLTLADAAARGKCIIATRYSGPTDFLADDAYLGVPYARARIGRGNYPYPASGYWAEPDAHFAGTMMRWSWQHPERARELGSRAQQGARTRHSVPVRAAAARTALAELDTADPKPTTASTNTPGRSRIPAWPIRSSLHRQSRRLLRLGGQTWKRP